MKEYVIMGTSHEIQDTPEMDDPVRKAVAKHSVVLLAEEYPFRCPSTVMGLAENLQITYLQVDPYPEDWNNLGICHEMSARGQFPQGKDIRLSHADSVRENVWLDKIEEIAGSGRVLVVCGYLHVKFLAQKVRKRGGTVLKETAFPDYLLSRQPEMDLDPAGLEDYQKKLLANFAVGF